MARILATTNPNKSEREARNEQRSRRVAAQGMVLLYNNGVLPLKKAGKIALYGRGARKTVKGGTGSGDVMSRYVSNVEQGLEEAGFTVVSKRWLDKFDADAEAAKEEKMKQMAALKGKVGIKEILQMLLDSRNFITSPIMREDIEEDCDTAVYVISRDSGEGVDRKVEQGDYLLHVTEEENLRMLTESYGEVIVVLNVGGVVDTEFIRSLPGVSAILLMSQGGCMGGHALADVLTGKVTPSGHLTATWAKKYEDYPCSGTFGHRNGNLDDEYYTEGIYVGYRYFDTFHVEPAYPFGYGLSYTDFIVRTDSVCLKGEKVEITVQVTNIGKEYCGREVVQVYYSAPAGKLEKAYQELAAYAKTKELMPGENEVLTLSFSVRDMASYSEEKAAYVLEAGTYYVRVGVHSRSTHIVAAIELAEEAVTQQLSNCLICDCPMEQLSANGIAPYTYEGEEAEKAQAPVHIIPAGVIGCTTVEYRNENREFPKAQTEDGIKITLNDVAAGKYTLEELVAQLTVEEMADLCVGAARNGWGAGSVIGAASTLCPGAAGDTSSAMVQDRNIRNIVLADGPAGLRLSTVFGADSQGRLIPGTQKLAIPGLAELLEAVDPELAKQMGGAGNQEIPEDGARYYQYATAIPIAVSLAQTWDPKAVEDAGAIVGEEMAEFGVTLWLAPGMNIHRNPLCGRNFEYYSEDPLVSGSCAVADTRGVQKFKGTGVTIKHFALNNQEDNRFHVNAHASERAIREIYLKGFELAVKQACPMAIMSSYNLINGTHTANNRDLLTAVARDEWGFRGLIMTDWETTSEDKEKHKYGSSSAAGCILAGNDLIMPGKQKDVDEIIHSVGAKEGETVYPITLGDLQACAEHILRTIMRCLSEE